MSPLPTLPRRSWPERSSLALAAVLVGLALASLAGWGLRMETLLQPFGSLAAVKINAAVAFLFIGGALLALEFGRRPLAWIALLPILVGLLTLVEDAFKLELRIDEILGKDHLLIGTEHPGRMASMVAVCLVMSGAVLAWRATEIAGRARLFAEAVSGSFVASAGFSTLLGYALGLPIVYCWGTATATAPIEAIVLMCLGLALILLAWRESSKAEGEAPTWAPMPAVIGCLTLSVVLYVGLREREGMFTKATTQAAMDRLAITIKDALDRESSQFERIARRWGDGPPDATRVWKGDAITQMSEASEPLGCLSIHYVDLRLQTHWVYPDEKNEGAIGFNHATSAERQSALQKAGAISAPVISATTLVPVPGKGVDRGFVIYAPIIRAGRLAGYLGAEFGYRRFFHTVTTARARVSEDYHVAIEIGGESLYSTMPGDPVRDDDLTLEKTYTIVERRVRLSLTPSGAALAQSRHYLPQVVLVTGLGITFLLGLSIHLARSARAGQRAAEHSNRKLFAENEERRRIEARLKVSDERLRLALDSTQIGIFEWSVSAGHVYYSPGLWAMLGYEHGRMPSTVEAWQSLVHPDDLPVYRRRTESQLNGVTTFIEPEYRVRARNGSWRWVYTRSKSVTTHPDGRPIRIIGTVQDITARREAEFALRESQAEARKLSLVAAKTDNPVLIGSADGRIEWVNEAFCRVMEYTLDEVVGKNPAHFMIGPETNPRTVVRIRAAMARGLSISTDVVNYSKSGRKYHLHLEIQPVRGANGQIENYIAVETDITARVETERELRRAKAEADDASRAKSEFLASMSHEIRTPMNGVIGMTSLLMETTLTADQRDYVNTIRTSGEALLTIINDILDFSKIESGKMELERAPFELNLCLEEALDLFALQAAAKKVELGYHMAADVPAWIIGDVTRLRQVLVNLINNAVKFTPGGSISVEVRRAVREPAPIGFEPAVDVDPAHMILEFTVSDTGIGIPADRLDRLFRAFSQVDSSTTRKYGGTGLGLAICQRLCSLMGGGIRVESSPGQGSSFIFTIETTAAPGGTEPALAALPPPLRDGTVLCLEDHPVTQARLRTIFEKWGLQCVVASDAAAAEGALRQLAAPPGLLVIDAGDATAPPTIGALASLSCPRLLLLPFGQSASAWPHDNVRVASTSKPIRNSAFVSAVQTLFQARGQASALQAPAVDRPVGEEIPLEVLLAEDNAVNQKVALRFLERLGYRADAVANGLEAVTTLERRHYDLVLMDLQMPEMDGLEATRQIRARLPANRQPKIIALTANAMQGDRELCVAAGMDDHISKPVKMHEIAAAIRRHFGRPAEVDPASQLIG